MQPGSKGADRLTKREREVVSLAADGLLDEQIAEQLGIARSTVAAVLRSAMAALGVQSRREVTAYLADTPAGREAPS